ncbi:MAG: hypothetical protein GC192_07865 [Bacteroidetes bacterium]|nr:hypothetical protein [Bacteroidota bacterium]
MNTYRKYFLTLVSIFVFLSCDEKDKNECLCPIGVAIDKSSKEQTNSNKSSQEGIVELEGKTKEVAKKLIQARGEISGEISNYSEEIEEVSSEILANDPSITQKINIYRIVACAFYDVTCKSKSLTDIEKDSKYIEIIEAYKANVATIFHEEGSKVKNKESKKSETPTQQKVEMNDERKTNTISGIVTEISGNTAIKDARVYIYPLDTIILTDDNGRFSLSSKAISVDRTIKLSISKKGYEEISRHYTVPAEKIEVKLKKLKENE